MQSKCPPIEEWIKKMWYIYTIEYYSATKNEQNCAMCKDVEDLETVIQGEVRKRNTYKLLYEMCFASSSSMPSLPASVTHQVACTLQKELYYEEA